MDPTPLWHTGQRESYILAKKGSKIMQKEKQKLSYESIKSIVKKKVNENYNFHLIDTYVGCKKERKLIHFWHTHSSYKMLMCTVSVISWRIT